MRNSYIKFYLATLILFSYAYFYHGALWGQNARLDSIYALVEDGSFKINKFIVEPNNNINTGDWAFYEGNYYSNKAPGIMLLGAPVYFSLFKIENLLGIDPFSDSSVSWNAYLINIFVTVIPLLLGILAFYECLLFWGHSQNTAVLNTLLISFASMFFPYSTQLWGHCTAAAFILMAVYALLQSRFVLTGFLLGFSVLTEYSAAIPAALILAYPLSNNNQHRFKICLGGLLPALFFCSYNYLLFGNVFAFAQSYSNPAFLQQDNIGGMFAGINFLALKGLTFSLYRGLFIYTPILILAFWFCFQSDNKIPKCLRIISILNIILLLLFNSLFNGWHGGASALARYQIIAMPFWFYLIAEARGGIARLLAYVLGVFSFVNMLVIAAIGAIIPDLHPSPIFDLLYPEFFKGNFAFREFPHRLQQLSPDFINFHHTTAWAFPHKLGLESYSAIAPLLIFWLIMLGLIRKELGDGYKAISK